MDLERQTEFHCLRGFSKKLAKLGLVPSTDGTNSFTISFLMAYSHCSGAGPGQGQGTGPAQQETMGLVPVPVSVQCEQ